MSVGGSDHHVILTSIVAAQPEGGSTIIQKVRLDIVPTERPDPDPVAANVIILDSIPEPLCINSGSASVADLAACNN